MYVSNFVRGAAHLRLYANPKFQVPQELQHFLGLATVIKFNVCQHQPKLATHTHTHTEYSLTNNYALLPCLQNTVKGLLCLLILAQLVTTETNAKSYSSGTSRIDLQGPLEKAHKKTGT